MLNPTSSISSLFFLVYLIGAYADFPLDRSSHLWENSRRTYPGHPDNHVRYERPHHAFDFPHSHHRPRSHNNDHDGHSHYHNTFGSNDWDKRGSKWNTPLWFIPTHHGMGNDHRGDVSHDNPSDMFLNTPLETKSENIPQQQEKIAEHHEKGMDKGMLPVNGDLHPVGRNFDGDDVKILSEETPKHDRSHAVETKMPIPHLAQISSENHGSHRPSVERTRGLSEKIDESHIARRMETLGNDQRLLKSAISLNFDNSKDQPIWNPQHNDNHDKNIVETDHSFKRQSPLSNVAGNNPPMRRDEMLVDDSMHHHPHQIFMERFSANGHNVNANGFETPKLDEPHGPRDPLFVAGSSPPKQIDEGAPIEFTSGAFKTKRPNEDGADGVFGGKLLSAANNHNNNNNKNKAHTTWMNFRVLVDENGKFKLEMSPSISTFNQSPTNGLQAVASTIDQKESNQYMSNNQHHFDASQANQMNIHPQARPLTETRKAPHPHPPISGNGAFAPFRMDRPMFDDMHHGQPGHHPFPPRQPFPDIHHPVRHPGPMPHNPPFQHEVGAGQPKLLSERLTPANPIDTGDSMAILDAVSIPLNIDVDNPFTSGCGKLQCPASCPGELRKLSPTTGCPTCDCCPIVQCNIRCAFGYDADNSGCPVCKCLTQ